MSRGLVIMLAGCALFSGVFAAPEIDREEAMHHLRLLASDAMEGRKIGERGNYVAGAYLAREFERYGLLPGGDDGTFFRNFPYRVSRAGGTSELVVTGPEGSRTFAQGRAAESFGILGGGGSEPAEGEVVFVGYGVTAPEHGYDDYAGVDVRGKVVLMLRYEPGEREDASPFDGAENTTHAHFDTKLANAAAHGAVAAMLVTGPAGRGPEERLPRGRGILPLTETAAAPWSDVQNAMLDRYGLDWDSIEAGIVPPPTDSEAEAEEEIPFLMVGLAIADAILAGSGRDLEGIQQGIDATYAPASFPVEGVRARVIAPVETVVRTARNVVGILRGSDSARNAEAIVIGAHYDHLGFGSTGSRSGERAIHNGADDNASGTAALLEVAEALAPSPPSRTIVFIAFDGEEGGLRGAAAYVRDPTHPLERTVAMINMDMVGRGEPNRFSLIGSLSGPTIDALADPIAERLGLSLRRTNHLVERSDQLVFYRKEIPIVFLNGGMPPEYHTPEDDIDLLVPEKIENAARFVAELLRAVADMQGPIPFNDLTDEREAESRELADRPVLGVGGIVPFAEGGVVGVRIGDISPGGAAAAAGLREGDVLLRFGDAVLDEGPGRLVEVIRSHSPGDRVRVVYLREGEEHETEVVLQRRGA